MLALGVFGSLDETVSVAVRDPSAAGAKITVNTACPCGGSIVAKFCGAIWKSPALGPLAITAETLRGPEPVLLTFITYPGDDVPTLMLPQITVAALRVICGTGAMHEPAKQTSGDVQSALVLQHPKLGENKRVQP